MNVAILISDIHSGGAEYTARRWAAALNDRGHTVSFYVFKPEISKRDVDLGGASVVRLVTSTSRLRHVQIVLRLARRVRRDGIDVVLCMGYYPNLAGLAAKLSGLADVAIVVSERNVLSLVHAERGRRQGVIRWLAGPLYRRADGVVAISHPVAGDLIGRCRIDPGLVTVVPNPVLDDAVGAGAGAGPSKLNPTLVFVGRIEPQKQPFAFVEMLAALARRGLEPRGLVIGTGSLAGQMRLLAERAGVELEFAGWREPWTDVHPKPDCLVLPSGYEGFGNVLVEAAAAGIPSVAPSSALGVADAIVPGVTGELAASDSADDLADAVQRSLRAGPLAQRDLSGWFARFGLAQSADLLELALVRARDRT